MHEDHKKEEKAKKKGEDIDLTGAAVGNTSGMVEAVEDCGSDAEAELLKKASLTERNFEASPVPENKTKKTNGGFAYPPMV